MKLHDQVKPLVVHHESDLFNIFPNYENFTFDGEFCNRILSETSDLENYDDLEGWDAGLPKTLERFTDATGM